MMRRPIPLSFHSKPPHKVKIVLTVLGEPMAFFPLIAKALNT